MKKIFIILFVSFSLLVFTLAQNGGNGGNGGHGGAFRSGGNGEHGSPGTNVNGKHGAHGCHGDDLTCTQAPPYPPTTSRPGSGYNGRPGQSASGSAGSGYDGRPGQNGQNAGGFSGGPGQSASGSAGSGYDGRPGQNGQNAGGFNESPLQPEYINRPVQSTESNAGNCRIGGGRKCPAASDELLAMVTVGGTQIHINQDARLTWEEANTYCADNGLQLLSLPNKGKNDELAAYLIDTIRYNLHFWTSGRRTSSQYRFMWTAISEPFSYTRWESRSVNPRPGEDCVTFVEDNGELQYTWVAEPCGRTNQLICEKL